MPNMLAAAWRDREPAGPMPWAVEPIHPSHVARHVAADVVVVGAGFAGLCAAASAAERGARTIVIEKGAGPAWRGLRVGAVGDRLQREGGIAVDRDAIVAEMMRWSGYKADQRLVTMWVDESGAALDWVYDMLEAAGETLGVVPIEQQVPPERPFTYYPITNLVLDGGHETLARVLRKACEDRGAELHFGTPALQLVQDADGRVIGVIAKDDAGDLVQYDAPGVVLCTGDYGHDPDMVRAFAPHVEKTFWNLYMPPLNTGDGHKMGMAAGGAMDEAPHCALIFDIAVVDSPRPMLFPLGRQPFLNVNLKGERYVNEELPFAFTCRADAAQPGGCKWVIWDAKWREDTARFGMIICKSMQSPVFNKDDLAFLLDNDVIKTADTIEGLAAKTGLPAETLSGTVARYNDLARGGKDLDFGKIPGCLSTIEQGPFHAVKMGPALLVTLGGLKVNTRLEVLDDAGDPIPGLYAAGNASGGFFANDYPINVSGITHGRAITFGRLAGQHAAAAAATADQSAYA